MNIFYVPHRFFVFAALFYIISVSVAFAAPLPNVAYTGVYLMGDKKSEVNFPVYSRTKNEIRDALRITMKQIDAQGKLPFRLLFDTSMEDVKGSIENTMSLAFLVVRDDIVSEKFSTHQTSITKTIINIGLVAILYDTRKIDGKSRNTIIYSFPLVGYAQRVDGDKSLSNNELNQLFINTATQTLKQHLLNRLASVSIDELYGTVIKINNTSATISIGTLSGLEEGQNVTFYDGQNKIAMAPVTSIDKDSATVDILIDKPVKTGMRVQATNMRAVSDETYQVVSATVTSKKAASYFTPETIGPQVAQWYSNFLTDRGGKTVMPSRVGGSWDERSTATSFSILDHSGLEHQFSSPRPKYPVELEITGLTKKIVDSNNVNDICLYKVWMKLTVKSKKYDKEFDLVSSKTQIKDIHQFDEKNEFFDLLYQLSAKIAKEAEI